MLVDEYLEHPPDGCPESVNIVQRMGFVPGIFESLNSDPNHGIPGVEYENKARIAHFGQNLRQKQPIKGIGHMISVHLQDKNLQILFLAATLTLMAGFFAKGVASGWLEGVSVYFAIAFIVTLAASNDFWKQTQFVDLSDKVADQTIRVRRQNKNGPQEISIFDLLVGDVIYLE